MRIDNVSGNAPHNDTIWLHDYFIENSFGSLHIDIERDGDVNVVGLTFRGVDIFECRDEVISKLKKDLPQFKLTGRGLLDDQANGVNIVTLKFTFDFAHGSSFVYCPYVPDRSAPFMEGSRITNIPDPDPMAITKRQVDEAISQGVHWDTCIRYEINMLKTYDEFVLSEFTRINDVDIMPGYLIFINIPGPRYGLYSIITETRIGATTLQKLGPEVKSDAGIVRFIENSDVIYRCNSLIMFDGSVWKTFGTDISPPTKWEVSTGSWSRPTDFDSWNVAGCVLVSDGNGMAWRYPNSRTNNPQNGFCYTDESAKQMFVYTGCEWKAEDTTIGSDFRIDYIEPLKDIGEIDEIL